MCKETKFKDTYKKGAKQLFIFEHVINDFPVLISQFCIFLLGEQNTNMSSVGLICPWSIHDSLTS